jgi:hypothetical protein
VTDGNSLVRQDFYFQNLKSRKRKVKPEQAEA